MNFAYLGDELGSVSVTPARQSRVHSAHSLQAQRALRRRTEEANEFTRLLGFVAAQRRLCRGDDKHGALPSCVLRQQRDENHFLNFARFLETRESVLPLKTAPLSIRHTGCPITVSIHCNRLFARDAKKPGCDRGRLAAMIHRWTDPARSAMRLDSTRTRT